MFDTLLTDPLALRSGRLLVMALAAVLAAWLAGFTVRRMARSMHRHSDLGPSEGEKRLKTIGSIIHYTVVVVVIALFAVGVLGEFGISVVPFLGTLGIAGVALGLGAQNLLRDYINGAFLLLENHYGVDDWVRLAGVDGRVEVVTLRMTQLRDLDGNVHVVPNGEIKVVTNLTKGWSRVVVDVAVAYKEDVDRVVEVLRATDADLQADPNLGPSLLEPLQVKAVQELGDSGVKIRLVYKVTPEQQWDIRRALKHAVKKRFDAEGIEIPFPHRKLYFADGPEPKRDAE